MEPLSVGKTMGPFALEQRLGVGSYGEVWLVHTAEGQARALKASPIGDRSEIRSFRHEFEKLRPLRLPHVVRVYETGTDNDYAWFTMDVVDGQPFNTWVQAGRTLKGQVQRLCAAGAQVARGLASIHRVGLAHRDLKPANIHVDAAGRATILDFGTARFGATRESSSAMMGTIPYMAPEQRVGMPHDLRVDAYSLGATLHECLSGIPAGRWRPGRPRPTLMRMGADVPMALAWLVDRLLSLDPSARPTADEAALLLQGIADESPLPPVPWPSPAEFHGDASRLLTGGPYVIVGALGAGRSRLLQEARWQWYRRGYRSLAARCRPDLPFGGLRDLLLELFRSTVSSTHRGLAGDDAAILQAIWPGLPVEVSHAVPWPPAPEAIADAMARVFQRHAPLAVVLFDVDEADIGTSSVLQPLLSRLPDGVLLWATSRRPVAGFKQLRAPPWTPAGEREVLPSILPDGIWPEGPPGRTPLESCAKAWRMLAAWRGQAGPPHLAPGDPLASDLQELAVLDEPFPTCVARGLAQNVSALVAAGHLVPAAPPGDRPAQKSDPTSILNEEATESTDLLLRRVRVPEQTHDADSLEEVQWLRFSDPCTRMLARATGPSIHDRDNRAARVWAELPASAVNPDDRTLSIARHAARAGTPHPDAFGAAAAVALRRGEPSEVDRWLQLRQLHGGDPHAWEPRYARISADLDLEPTRVHREAIRNLGRMAVDEKNRALAGLLLLRFEATRGEPANALRQGTRWADQLQASHPHLAGQMRRETAVAALAMGSVDEAVELARVALALTSPPAHHDDPLAIPSLANIDATCTLVRALIDKGVFVEARTLAETLLRQCQGTGRNRGVGRLSVLLAELELFAGDRDAALSHLSVCRAVGRLHPDPRVAAHTTLLEARIAIEQGDPTAATALMSEARAASVSHGLPRVRRDIAALSLELAVHSADAETARHARLERAALTLHSAGDLWPAALARWRWLTGDLAGAIEATTTAVQGPARYHAQAENARMLLIAGRYPDARKTARATAIAASERGLEEVALFCRLVEGAAAAWPDDRYLPLLARTNRARWTHLYLGALHLDAIRRQLQGSDPRASLSELRVRSAAVGHRLYLALCRAEGW